MNQLINRSARRARSVFLAGLVGCLMATPFSSLGQMTLPSRYYYAIENLETGEIIRRGQTTTKGIPQTGLILAPSTPYREWLLEADTGHTGFADFSTPGPGARFDIPSIRLGLPLTPDSDGDGLSDDAERIINANPTNAFSFVAGVKDGEAARLGLIDNSGAFTGITGSVKTPGTAVDVCALNDVVVVANGSAGVSIFNVFNRMSPLILAQMETPGNATAVGCWANLIAVADGSAGLAVVDIGDPSDARIIHQVDVGGTAQAIAAAGGLGFVGTSAGILSVVDLPTGFVFQQVNVGSSIEDVVVEQDKVYVYTTSQLRVLTNAFGQLGLAGSTGSPGGQAAFNGRGRMFVANGLAYLAYASGYYRYSVSNTAAPLLLNVVSSSQTGWKQVVPNGSGGAVVARGVNARDDGTHDVSLYDLINTATNAGFITEFQTPGVARAVAIYNGLAYVADSGSWLDVINYRAFDNAGRAPTITIAPSFALSSPTNGVIEEGKLFWVTARVTDDVQVRNVEFYLDGVKALTDGNYPFEAQFTAPRRVSRTSFTLQARASDTGGNFAFSELIKVDLLPDRTPPRIVGTQPASGSISTNVDAVFVYFSEPLDPGTLTGTNLVITSAGADHRFDTGDDVNLSSGSFSFRDSINAGVVSFPTNLPVGQYRIALNGVIRDLAGNALTNPAPRTFWMLPDGPNGDYDNDGVTNALEVVRGTDPLNGDSDGDGWDDGVELADGSDPLDANSRPRMTVVAVPPIEVHLATAEETGIAGAALVVAAPPIEIYLSTPEDAGIAGTLLAVAQPPVEVYVPTRDDVGISGIFTVVAIPPIEAYLPTFEDAGTAGSLFVLAQPPAELYLPTGDDLGMSGATAVVANPALELYLPTFDDIGSAGIGTWLAQPPLELQLSTPETTGEMGVSLILAQPPAEVRFSTNTSATLSSATLRQKQSVSK